jgi:hypothetical protein
VTTSDNSSAATITATATAVGAKQQQTTMEHCNGDQEATTEQNKK